MILKKVIDLNTIVSESFRNKISLTIPLLPEKLITSFKGQTTIKQKHVELFIFSTYASFNTEMDTFSSQKYIDTYLINKIGNHCLLTDGHKYLYHCLDYDSLISSAKIYGAGGSYINGLQRF